MHFSTYQLLADSQEFAESWVRSLTQEEIYLFDAQLNHVYLRYSLQNVFDDAPSARSCFLFNLYEHSLATKKDFVIKVGGPGYFELKAGRPSSDVTASLLLTLGLPQINFLLSNNEEIKFLDIVRRVVSSYAK